MLDYVLHQYKSPEMPVMIMMLFQFQILVTVRDILSVLFLSFQLYIREIILPNFSRQIECERYLTCLSS